MNNYIMYKRGATARTGRLLIRSMYGVRSQRSLERGLTSPRSVHKLIRWGISEDINGVYPAYTLNSPTAINNAANKLRALKLMRERGVNVPTFFDNKHEAMQYATENDCFMVGRTTSHQGGSGFNMHVMPDSIYHDSQSSHFLEYINVRKEWRVHVFRGEVIGVSTKTDDGVEHRITNRYTRNHTNGWRFVRCDLDRVQDRLKAIGVEAVKALGLDFGAVDVILSEDTRNYLVLEVNSAPSLEQGSTILQKYIEKFRAWFDER